MEEEAEEEEEEMKGKEEEDAILFVRHWFMWRVTSFKPTISTLTENDEHFSMRMWTLLQFCTTKTRRQHPEDSQRQGDIRRAETWTTVAKSVVCEHSQYLSSQILIGYVDTVSHSDRTTSGIYINGKKRGEHKLSFK